MFVNLYKNKDGSHAYQIGGEVQEGWAVIPDDFDIPEAFPYVDIKVEEVTHPAITTVEYVYDRSGEVVEEKIIVLEPEYTQLEVVDMIPGEIIEINEPLIPSQIDILEAQVTYTAMMTDTLLEV